jgi:excisionase family DNA binding protein
MSPTDIPLPHHDPFYRVKQIAEFTGKHEMTVRKAIYSGALRSQKLGPRSVGSRASWVNAWLSKLAEAKPEGEAA